MKRCDLTHEQALNDGSTSLAELHDAPDTHYPGLGSDAITEVVTFELQ